MTKSITDQPANAPNPVAILAFLRAFGLSLTAVAAEVGIPATGLNNKLSPAYRNKLNASDEAGIRRYFQRLHAALGTFLDSDLTGLPDSLPSTEIAPKSSATNARAERITRDVVSRVPESVTTIVLTRENDTATLRYAHEGEPVTQALTEPEHAALAQYFPAPTATSAGDTATSTRVRLLRRFKLDMLLK